MIDVLASLSEIHGVLGVVVDLDRLRQRLGVPAVTLARHMAALGAVMIFVHQVVPGSESHQPGIVSRCRD